MINSHSSLQSDFVYALLYCYWLDYNGPEGGLEYGLEYGPNNRLKNRPKNHLEASILHAIGAELYRGEQLLAKARPIHCYALGDRVIKMHLRSILETFSRQSQTAVTSFQSQIDVLLSQNSGSNSGPNLCPVGDCQLHATTPNAELL